MATLTKSTGTVTLSGAAEKVTLPASYGWVWVKNMSEGNIFAGLSADISEGADGVMTIPSGECGRIQMDGSREFYLLGTGNALVAAQNYADCPFKVVKKGGGSSGQLGVYPIAEDGRPTGDVVVPEGVTSLNQYVVKTGNSSADSRITSVTLPGTLKKLEGSALQGLSSITSIDLKNVTELSSLALFACSSLTEIIGTKLERIESRAFGSSSKIKKIELPNTLTYIDTSSYYAFLGCTDLSELSVQEGFNCDLKIMQGNLSAEQMRAIIANYAENSGKTLTVGSTNLAKLSDDDIAAASEKGLTLA